MILRLKQVSIGLGKGILTLYGQKGSCLQAVAMPGLLYKKYGMCSSGNMMFSYGYLGSWKMLLPLWRYSSGPVATIFGNRAPNVSSINMAVGKT